MSAGYDWLTPAAGGRIFILVSENDDIGAELINGLPTPNPAILTEDEINTEAFETDPCAETPFNPL